MGNKRKRTTIYLPDELHLELKVYDAKTQQEMSKVVEQSLRKYLRRT